VLRPPWIISALTLAVIGLAFPAVRHLREVSPPPPPSLKLTLGAPPGTELGSGDEPLDAAISPDERQIVFVATREGMTMLWRRSLASDRADPIAGTERAQLPAWNPSGDALLFFAEMRLRTLTLADSKVSDIADVASPSGATWLPDGSILFAPQSSGVIQRWRNGMVTDATMLRSGDRAHTFPLATGTANEFVYTAVADNGRRTVRLVRNGEERDLATTSGHGQIVGGYLLIVRDEILSAQRLGDGAVVGRSTQLATGVGTTTGGRSLFTASPRILLSAAASPRARQLTWFDMNGVRTGTMGETGDLWQVRLSPDDQHAAVTQVAPLLRTLDIAIVPASSSATTQPLTLALAADTDPVWAADGRRVAFRSMQTGRPAVFTKRALEKDAEEVVLLEGDATPSDWRAQSVVVHATEAASGYDVIAIDEAQHTRTTLARSGFNDTDGRWSPDGMWLAYVSDESGRPDIYANGGDGNRVRVSFGGGTRPRWSRDGRSLFFLRGSAVMRAMRADTTPATFAPATPVLDVPGIRDFDIAHRRDAWLAIVPVNASQAAAVSAVVDWQSGVPRAQ
jgi:Tol biopolymer transport system component